jgi:hypothetical protein
MNQFRVYCFCFINIVFTGSSLAEEQFDASVLDLTKNLEVLGQYYQQVQSKLKNPRDPFAYTEKMHRNSKSKTGDDNDGRESNNSSVAVSAVSHSSFSVGGLPIMKFRGYTESTTGESLGLFEVKGVGVYTVRKGDNIGLQQIVSELVLTVIEINRHNIIVETGTLGEKMVIQ